MSFMLGINTCFLEAKKCEEGVEDNEEDCLNEKGETLTHTEVLV